MNQYRDILEGDGAFLLKFNGITKICTNRLLLNPSGDVSMFQWYTFQLQEMLKDVTDEISEDIDHLTRQELGTLVKTHLIDIRETYNPESGLQYGLQPKTRSGWSLDNIGGVPVKTIVSNRAKNDVVWSDDNSFHYIDLEQQRSYYEYESQAMSPQSRSMWPGLGAHGNSCYMNTVLTLLLKRTSENKLYTLLSDALDENKEEDDLSKELANILHHLNHSHDCTDPFTVDELVTTFETWQGNLQQYMDDEPHDTAEFLQAILDNIHCSYKPFTLHSEVLSRGPIHAYEFGQSLENFSDIEGVIPKTVDDYTDLVPQLIFNTQSPIPLVAYPHEGDIPLHDLLCYREYTEIDGLEPPYYQIYGHDTWTFDKDVGRFETKEETDGPTRIYLPTEEEPVDGRNYSVYDDETETFRLGDEIIGQCGLTQSIHTYSITKASSLILTLQRRNTLGGELVNEINRRPVLPDETLRVPDPIHLFAIITFQGDDPAAGHYFGFYLSDGIWYRYNDQEIDIVQIGNYDDLLHYDDEWVKKNGVMYFYS